MRKVYFIGDQNVNAARWFKNGDHPDDDIYRPFEDTGRVPLMPREGLVVRYYRSPDIPGSRKCEKCGCAMHNHGWIDQGERGVTVCPGDWVVRDNGTYSAISDERFSKICTQYRAGPENAGQCQDVYVSSSGVSCESCFWFAPLGCEGAQTPCEKYTPAPRPNDCA